MNAVAEALCELPIQGMTCASCVARVEEALQQVPGVREANVNLALNKATIHYHPDETTPSMLAQAVVASGYEVPELGGLDARGRAEALAEVERDEERRLQRDFLLSLGLTLPLLVLAMSHGAIPGADGPAGRWLQFALATPVVFGPGRRFLRLAWVAFQHRTSDMNTLVSLGVLSAFLYSAVSVLSGRVHAHVYFEAAAAIVTFVLLGKRLETRARRRLSDAVRGLVALAPTVARRVRGELEEEVSVEALFRGDRVRVRPGERVPTDGVVLDGRSAVDESMLTGESMPIDKHPGDHVFGGTLNHEGSVLLEVRATGRDTALARIVEAVEAAQGQKAPIARLADRVSHYFVPIVLLVAAITFVVWLSLDPSSTGASLALERFVAVLVIACPCALGLATPAAVAVGTGRGAELGVLLKGGVALETASQLQTLFMDKTGTLTNGTPALIQVQGHGGFDESELLRLTAAAERPSEHPIARSIVAGAIERGIVLPRTTQFSMDAGAGVQAEVDGHRVRVGKRAWLMEVGVEEGALNSLSEKLSQRSATPSFVVVDGVLAGFVAISDEPRPESKAVLAELEAMGLEVVMLTGDRTETANDIASRLGIRRVVAEARPGDKLAAIEAERERGRIVGMVGDGINDAPALVAADVGIAIGSGADIALAAADVALLRGGMSGLPTAIRLARATMHTIRRNLFFAFIYNVIGIPVAAGALYPWTGFALSPVLASAAMSLSSVSVILSSLSLKRQARS
jgi:Cu+-exporting ATPase